MNVTFEDFKQIEIRIGKVINCEKVGSADKPVFLVPADDVKEGSVVV